MLMSGGPLRALLTCEIWKYVEWNILYLIDKKCNIKKYTNFHLTPSSKMFSTIGNDPDT